ncbi:hypothetical protein ACRE_071420 [Hapsidospora chrysogenum ATCC 11550]|uniref:Uncharacterized protein n=1 Tax=Hapsidospora chrysogenum (strain ATCC 11550 / CBS 779.69 / DSM 880 / IAM 14645 / JCM 23072 / IMI 49137) TaxID=857340 RepID=A0A086SYG3_HAPC1|nr:hypothetical protein ACRE_071420 [Hapsidospora chrysogenum ATCC 11550]
MPTTSSKDVAAESPSTSTPCSARTEQEYIAMLAKEFSSIPDREVPPPEPQDENQLSAANQTAKITPRPEKESIDSRNVVIAKTIRSALADMRL